MRFVFIITIIIIIIIIVFIVDVNIHHLFRSSPIIGGRETSDSDTSSSRLSRTPPSDLGASKLLRLETERYKRHRFIGMCEISLHVKMFQQYDQLLTNR